MSNPSSPPKSPLSQEIEIPSLFNFSIPPPEGSPSTPVCGVGETDEFITLHTDVLESPISNPIEILPCSPMIILLGKDSQNFEAQRVDSDEEEDEEETPLVWSRKRIQRANALTMVVSNLGATEAIPEIRFEEEPTDSEIKKKRKGKGKIVESSNKGDKRRYATRRTVQKLLGDALTANKAQIERNHKQRRLCVPTEEPISLPQEIGSSKIESEDIVRGVMKWKKEAEEDQIKAK
ncbi:hypothetical protein H5410_027071 [Solanum commersonii]|uniref:Uncharacterized protein n=1 Tax=Solanum commersonii TaxID=4109 RepID=A0A9J5YXZ8_SOLCO|nr:hypothetical protein H5410_027071 [Solanum commersonii]